MNIISLLNARVFALLLPGLLFIAGVVLLARERGAPFTRPRFFFRALFPAKTERTGGALSPFRALTVALAGTLGVGNIVGVSAAVIEGGAGALFWMWIAAFAAMPVKYAEVALSMRRREVGGDGRWHGGAMYYLRPRALGAAFAALIALSAFTLGNVIQIRAAADALSGTLGVPPVVTGIVSAVLAGVVLLGGLQTLSAVTVRLIPALSAAFVIVSMWIIAANAASLPAVFSRIISGAFTLPAAAGGVGGFALTRLLGSRALRFGVCRGLMSNEAGCGTAPIAHAASNSTPEAQGCWGVVEVFVDTILLCTLTGLVILIAFDPLPSSGVLADGMTLVTRAFSLYLGNGAAVFLAVSMALFAFATLVCWSHYGNEAMYFLYRLARRLPSDGSGWRYIRCAYTAAYCLAAVVGPLAAHAALWELTDLSVAAMTVINTAALLAESKRGGGGYTEAVTVGRSTRLS